MEITDVLESLKIGKISVSEAKKQLALYSIEKIEDFAQIDMGRKHRKGIPEVIFAERKTSDEIKRIIQRGLEKSDSVLISRIQKSDYTKIVRFAKSKKLKIKDGKKTTTLLIHKNTLKITGGTVGIVTAGTSDIGVAEETRLTCEQCIAVRLPAMMSELPGCIGYFQLLKTEGGVLQCRSQEHPIIPTQPKTGWAF